MAAADADDETTMADAKDEATVAAPKDEATVAAPKDDTVVLPPLSGKTRHTVIFLHGLGDEGLSWALALKPLLESMPDLKVICPTAPKAPVTVNFGKCMTSWHDIKSMQKIDQGVLKGLDASGVMVHRLIHQEIKSGTPSDKILLGGFSQGAALSLVCGYMYRSKLAGVVCLSGYLPYAADFPKLIKANNAKTPLFLAHGKFDGVVNLEAGQKAFKTLTDAGVPATYHEYPGMGHGTCGQEFDEMFDFIQKQLA